MQQSDQLKDEREAANFLGVSVSGLRKWRNRGIGPRYCRFGRLIRYRLSDLNEWIEAHKNEPCTTTDSEL
jgi:excisionase family DNA binding protein